MTSEDDDFRSSKGEESKQKDAEIWLEIKWNEYGRSSALDDKVSWKKFKKTLFPFNRASMIHW